MAGPTYNAGNSEEYLPGMGSGEVSEAGRFSENENGNTNTQTGNVAIDELIVELRHKFITILKSLYWEHFEEGQCQASSVTVLIESADRALDHENSPLADW